MDDVGRWLDVVERDRSRRAKLEEVAQGYRLAGVYELGIRLIVEPPVAGRGAMQRLDDARRIRVGLATVAEAVHAALFHALDARRERRSVAGERFARDTSDAEAADQRRNAGEVRVDEIPANAEGFEELSATIRAHRGHAHLREDLQQSLHQSAAVEEARAVNVVPRPARLANRIADQLQR